MDDADWVLDWLDAEVIKDELRSRCSVWWDWIPGVVFGATDVADDEMAAVQEVSGG